MLIIKHIKSRKGENPAKFSQSIHFACVLVVCGVLTGCSTDGCTENRSSIPLAQFYGSTGAQVGLDSLEITGIDAPHDSVLLAAGTKASEIYLPMRATKTQTSWCLAYRWKATDNPALNDTLTFDYQPIEWFAGEECGAMFRYRLTRVHYTRHLIDSVAVLAHDSVITNVSNAQLRIYFVTEDEE